MNLQSALQTASINRTDAEILLAALLKRDRTWILAHPAHPLSAKEELQWNSWKGRRVAHEPIAYIIGETEFYGRKFFVNRSVLIPRSATEGLVEMTFEILAGRGMPWHAPTRNIKKLDTGIVGVAEIWGDLADVRTVVDVGTGSGCIAITLALARPDLRIIATDSSNVALEVAMKNAKRYNISTYCNDAASAEGKITFLTGNLLEPIVNLREPFVVVSNPPYIPEERQLETDVENYEPREALRGGPEGMDLIKKLLQMAKNHSFCHGIVLECEEQQDKECIH